MESLYLTYYSVSSLIALFLGFTLGGYFLFLKGGSSAMRHIAAILLSAAMMNVAYVVSSTYFHPLAAFHRWLTVPFGLTMALHTSHVFLNYPRKEYPRLGRWMLIVQYVLAGLASLYFIWASLAAPRVFHFDGHYWDLIVDRPTRIVGLVILSNTVLMLVIAPWRAYNLQGRERWTLIAMFAALFSCGMAQGVANSLSREGVIGRDTFQTIFSLTIILGLFLVVIIFINNTSDRTSFMMKILGISMVTLLSVMQALTFAVLRERSRAYDELRRQEARAVVQGRMDEPTVPPLFLRKGSGDTQFFAGGAAFRQTRLPPLSGDDPAEAQSKSELRQTDLSLGRFRKARASQTERLPFVGYLVGQGAATAEVAFPYTSYRQYVHEGARTLALLLLLVAVVIVVGFPLFFKGALVTPVLDLLGAVRRVDKGDLETQVRIRVEDEIGQLGHYFNRMVVSIRDARGKLQEYAEQLEQKVRERTAELERTLGRVQELKDQQDGDYFLTSLLLRPLGSNRVQSETVNVDFLIRQKKTFRFRKWSDEIGGDLCMAESVQLRDRTYTVFLNADAMGKSMQGAGGALVLGAVLEAMVDRTGIVASAAQQYPERWLKNAFVELHKVFEVFDGSMLISLVLGLVEDQTGLVYVINAEHPWTVLYRQGRASFVDQDMEFRKLGTLGMEGTIYVKTIQLEPGDVLIAGSDGRDDLLLPAEDGGNYIQHDEQLFLRHVEVSEGRLERIHASLTSEGELTDDLSLLRIGYREGHAQARQDGHAALAGRIEQARQSFRLERWRDVVHALEGVGDGADREPQVLRLLAQAYLRLGDFERARVVAEDYAFIRPADTELLYVVSYCSSRCGDLEKAADFGERVRLREPHNARYLLNLGRIYHAMGNQARARGMVEKVLEREPGNTRAQRLAALL